MSTPEPLAGRDGNNARALRDIVKFQPTRPLRGATVSMLCFNATLRFQPTRPLRGATSGYDRNGKFVNPRAPCGARRLRQDKLTVNCSFQPTRPLRGATPRF